MPYSLTSQELLEYSFTRMHNLIYKEKGHRIMGVERLGDNKLKLFKFKAIKEPGKEPRVVTDKDDEKNIEHLKGDFITLEPSFSRQGDHYVLEITIAPDPNKAGVNGTDVCGFLESLINGDQIFSRGATLFSQERERDIKYWKSVLERSYDKCSGIMSCKIKDDNVSSGNLKRIYYEYMLRPSMCYLFKMGNFSSKTSKP